MVVENGEWEWARFVLPGGHSGNPFSPHYDYQVPVWLAGQGVPIACFFFNDTATTEIYTLSLPDALPISVVRGTLLRAEHSRRAIFAEQRIPHIDGDRKSTRLNSSHVSTSYAACCFKKKTDHYVFDGKVNIYINSKSSKTILWYT